MAGTLSSRVTLGGQAVAGARVYVINTETRTLVGTAISNETGHYTITGLPVNVRLHAAGEREVGGQWYAAPGSAHLLVTEGAPVVVDSVVVSPSSPQLTISQTVQLVPVARDADENILTGRPFTYVSLSTGVASVSGTGLVTGLAAGTAVIEVTCEGVTGTTTVSVVTVPDTTVATVGVTPTSGWSKLVGQTQPLVATPRNAGGNTLTGKTITYASNNESRATVNSSGLVTIVGLGAFTITATCETVNGTSSGTGTAPPDTTVASVALSPATFTLIEGGTRQLTPTARNAASQVLTGKAFTYASSDEAIATVSGSGLVTAFAEGEFTITVTCEGVDGTSEGTVLADDEIGSEGQGIMGANPSLVPLFYESARLYANAAAFRAVIPNRTVGQGFTSWIWSDNAKNGTAPSLGGKYGDGRYVDLIHWQNAVQILGRPAFELQVVGANLGDGSPTPELRAAISAKGKIWLGRRQIFPSNFTTIGDASSSPGIAWNAGSGGAKSFKEGPWGVPNTQNDRGGIILTNTDDVMVESLAGYSGLGETKIGEVTYWDGNAYDVAILLELYNDGSNKTAVSVFRKLASAPNSAYAQVGTRQVHTYSGSAQLWNTVDFLSKNYNNSRSTTLTWHVSDFVVFDATSGQDPWDVL